MLSDQITHYTMKQHRVMSAIRSLDKKFFENSNNPVLFKASTIAKECGYKSAVSVRETLYELVDMGVVSMTVVGVGKGCTSCRTYFYLTGRNSYSQGKLNV